MRRFASKDDVIDQVIVPAIGGFRGSYDVDQIFSDCFTYRADTDANGEEILNTAGFEQTASDREFWDSVSRNDKG